MKSQQANSHVQNQPDKNSIKYEVLDIENINPPVGGRGMNSPSLAAESFIKVCNL